MSDPYKKWLDDNPGELPAEVEDEAAAFGIDTSSPEGIAAVRDLLEMDPDIAGDWDAYQ